MKKKGLFFIGTFLPCFLFLWNCTEKDVNHSAPNSILNEEVESFPFAFNSEDHPDSFGFGRLANEGEINALNIDISSDGTGLPPGSGNVINGRQIYVAQCAACHGLNGIEGPNDKLIWPADTNEIPFGNNLKRFKTIGNYWPYATTVFDYIRRTMPFNAPGSLTDDEVYSLTAYLLSANKIIDSTFVLDAKSLHLIVMPARDLFIADDRIGSTEVK